MPMNLEVTFRNVSPRPEIRKRGEALYGKLTRFLDPAAEGHLIVNVEHDQGICEVVVKTRGQVFKAEEQDEDLRTAMDKVFHTVEEQLRRFKDKRTDRRGRSPVPETGFVAPDGDEDDEDVANL
jgi:ribosomal subunit interface protein